uniref:THD domain-containing protein n=1 Tax=Acanthochromis polyacanthus TaxID=80966 RepID=A0A3Q1GDV4_9TELE
MEGHEFCLVGGGGEAGLHRHHSADQQLIQRVTRLYRMAQFTVVLLLLLLSGALALLITVGLGGRSYRGNQIVGEYLQWEIGHCEGGFHYSNGDLVVPKDGFYRVFLQITYQSNGEHCPKAEMKLNNKVLCFTDSYPTDTPLLTSDDTVKCNKELWTKSLYTSGLFKLEANARLRVNATYPTFIARNNYEVFFGAERLP